ncbi:peptidase S10 serine carboxypeptidase [Artomyces pyxidatus]|uniref:Peptidase S10 serine carboxypeptidase n=1 Tax=Artomyces pyxidatus TaxID=48021 RepID=A0ACB8TL92_9AGAM|nr:peptidase S10 serine carboxypeptidase [Artomyces pyxidatus]
MLFSSWTSAVFLASVSGAVCVSQHPFSASAALSQAPGALQLDKSNETIVASTLYLSAVTSDSFTTLRHPKFPGHGVRVKKTKFCDPTVNVFTGYLDVDQGAKHLFFYFFESRRDPDKDDVMMWINGGPGCSSAMGLLMELGPCNIDMSNITEFDEFILSPNGTVWNPFSWTNEANVFFLDQPVGVGFSYADHGESVGTTEDAAKNIHAFLSIFFEIFDQFKGRPLHLAGESYGVRGRYLPVFASEIHDKNAVAEIEGRPAINLQSVIIGNGVTDISTIYQGRYAIECGTASLDIPVQTIGSCVRMKKALPHCLAAMDRSCIQMFDDMNCRAAVAFCDSELSQPMWSELTLADLGLRLMTFSPTQMCVGGNLCYLEPEAIHELFTRPEVLQALGVDSLEWTACSSDVGTEFYTHFDKFAVPTQYYVANLLDRGVRVLIYAGTYDWQCGWVANQLWLEKLEWSGQAGYVAAEWRDWEVDGSAAGETKTWGNLTFATVRGAGHMMSDLIL